MYRPENWKNPWNTVDDTSPPGYVNDLLITCYEAGADAMLEALKKEGSHQKIQHIIGAHSVGLTYFYEGDAEEGWLVFIPDGE